MLEAPAKRFQPRRDVDLFLDRTNKRMFAGYCQTVHLLKQILEQDNKFTKHKDFFNLVHEAKLDFVDFLGEHKYMSGLTTIPPSRFSEHNSNGLQEYSPFMCGVGLEEGLEIAYRIGMSLWERISEPMLIIHLHNAVLKKGYLPRPVGCLATLQELFKDIFFEGGRVPDSAFGDALMAKVGKPESRQSKSWRQAQQQKGASSLNLHHVLEPKLNHIFRRGSMLTTCRGAGWNLEAIPDEDLEFGSMLFWNRLSKTKRISESQLQDTLLVRKAKAVGMSDADIIRASSKLTSVVSSTRVDVPQEVLERYTPEGYTSATPRPSNEISGRDLLDFAKYDILTDVVGARPISSLNYLGVACWMIVTFGNLESRLQKAGNLVYREAYEQPGPWKNEKRIGLTLLAFVDENEECLKMVAETLNEARGGFMDFIYWEDLEDKPRNRGSNAPNLNGACTVM